MIWLTTNSAWITIIIAALSLAVSIWAIISAKKSNKRVEEYNNNSIRLKYRPVIEMENGYKVNPVECTITFNLISNYNEAILTKIVILTKDFACCQPRKYPFHMVPGDPVLANFTCYRTDDFHTSIFCVDIYYEDIIGNTYRTHIEGKPDGLTTDPAIFLPPMKG